MDSEKTSCSAKKQAVRIMTGAAQAVRGDRQACWVADRKIERSSLQFDPCHPICRGEFPVLIFSGSADILGDLAGEPTALAQHKFIMGDPRLPVGEDFAACCGIGLPHWPFERLQPTAGACFVFSDAGHPYIGNLRQRGGVAGQHWIVSNEAILQTDLTERLLAFAQRIPTVGPIVVLGYGQQGREIARTMVEQCGVKPARLLVHDGSTDSQMRARLDGFSAECFSSLPSDACAAIYSPLSHHRQLAQLAARARIAGLPVFNNVQSQLGLRHFQPCGIDLMDRAAIQTLSCINRTIQLMNSDLALPCSIARLEQRKFGDSEILNLSTGENHLLCGPAQAIDLSGPALLHSLDPATFLRTCRAFVGIGHRASHGMFAARQLAAQLWPQATGSIFPAEHEVELGSTGFERMLRNHLDAREIVCTMQTPAQRIMLGVAARHYACDRPLIEIGSALGGSALLMAAATEGADSPIHSIDPDAATRDIMRFAFEREGHAARLHQIIATSDAAVPQLHHLCGEAGLVFVDGLHTSAGVLADFELYSPMVAPGGALIFHDVAPQIHSVMRMVLGLALRDRRFEPKCLVDGLMIFERLWD